MLPLCSRVGFVTTPVSVCVRFLEKTVFSKRLASFYTSPTASFLYDYSFSCQGVALRAFMDSAEPRERSEMDVKTLTFSLRKMLLARSLGSSQPRFRHAPLPEIAAKPPPAPLLRLSTAFSGSTNPPGHRGVSSSSAASGSIQQYPSRRPPPLSTGPRSANYDASAPPPTISARHRRIAAARAARAFSEFASDATNASACANFASWRKRKIETKTRRQEENFWNHLTEPEWFGPSHYQVKQIIRRRINRGARGGYGVLVRSTGNTQWAQCRGLHAKRNGNS